MGDVYRQEKEKQEGGLLWGTYKNKEKKSRMGVYTRECKQTRKRKAGGGLTRGGGRIQTRKRKAKGGVYTLGDRRIQTRKRKAKGGLTPRHV